jgi:hypothetical protein
LGKRVEIDIKDIAGAYVRFILLRRLKKSRDVRPFISSVLYEDWVGIKNGLILRKFDCKKDRQNYDFANIELFVGLATQVMLRISAQMSTSKLDRIFKKRRKTGGIDL